MIKNIVLGKLAFGVPVQRVLNDISNQLLKGKKISIPTINQELILKTQ